MKQTSKSYLVEPHKHVAAYNRIPSVAIILCATYDWRHSTILRMGEDYAVSPDQTESMAEAFERDHFYRFRGAMAQEGVRYLVECVFPPGTVQYVVKTHDGYQEPTLFVPCHMPSVAKLLFLLGPSFMTIALPAAIVNHTEYDESELTSLLMEYFEGIACGPDGIIAEEEIDKSEEGLFRDFPKCALEPFIETVERLRLGRIATMTDQDLIAMDEKCSRLQLALERLETKGD